MQAMAAQHLESRSANIQEARTAQVERWRSRYGHDTGKATLWRPKGCSQCEQHGYRGRLGMHELMLSGEVLRQHIRHRASATEIRLSALAAGMRLQAGLVNLQTLQNSYTFDVKPRWNLADLQLTPALAS